MLQKNRMKHQKKQKNRMSRMCALVGVLVLLGSMAAQVVLAETEKPEMPEDVTPPEKVEFFYNTVAEGETLFFKETVELTLKCKDSEGEVECIYYKIKNGETEGQEEKLEGNEGTLYLEPGFSGTVEAYAMDSAGNRGEKSVSKEIICENTVPEIVVTMDGNETGWNAGPVSVYVTVSDAEISSGLQSLKCYVDQEVVVNQQPEHTEEKVTILETSFVVDCCSVNGVGIPVVIEVTDRAGNFQTKNQMLYIDMQNPLLEIEGCTDQMITGKETELQIWVNDENLLGEQEVKVWRTAPDQERVLYLEQGREQAVPMLSESGAGEAYCWEVLLEEDGIYEVQVTAADVAGNRSSISQSLVVDKTNPVIRYVEQMQGVHIPYFQWNYDVRDMIEDFTDYEYQMTLNGAMYISGNYVTEEGMKVLQVTATDAAGNESMAKALFCVDHTPPEIQIYKVEDGASYEDGVDLDVEVGGSGEVLESIVINSEEIALAEYSQIFHQTVETPGEYHVQVRAKDLAGNQADKEIGFTICKKSLKSVLFEPVKKVQKQVEERAEKQTGQYDEKEKDLHLFGWILAAAVLLVCVSGTVMWKKFR